MNMSIYTLSQLVEVALQERGRDIFSIAGYQQVKAFAEKNSLSDTTQAWKAKFVFEAFTPKLLERWKLSIEREFSGDQAICEKQHMYQLVSAEFPTLEFLGQKIDLGQNDFSSIQMALVKCESDYLSSQAIFNRVISSLNPAQEAPLILKLYEKRLKVPHRQLQDTYNALSSFVSEHFPRKYTQVMKAASKVFSSTLRSQRYYESLEQAVASDADSPENWIRYIQQVSLFPVKGLVIPAGLVVFYRSLFAGSRCKIGDPSWFDVWILAIRFSLKSLDFKKHERDLLFCLFLKNYPNDARAYSEVLWNITEENHLESIRLRVINAGLLSYKNSDCAVLAQDLLTLQRVLMKEDTPKTAIIENVVEIATAFAKCRDVLEFCLRMLENLPEFEPTEDEPTKDELSEDERTEDEPTEDEPTADELTNSGLIQVLDLALENLPSDSRMWLVVIEICDRRNFVEKLDHLVKQALRRVVELDDKKAVLRRLEMHFRLSDTHQSLSELHEGLQNFEQESKALDESSMKKRKSENAPVEQVQNSISSVSKEDSDEVNNSLLKKKKPEVGDDSSEPARSREQFRVKLFPLDPSTNESQIRSFLSGYADPLSITIAEDTVSPESQTFALIELSSEKEVLSCLTRQYKMLNGIPVNIERIFGTTVWATNYPLSYTANDIKRMIFDRTGCHCLSLRLPSQRDNKERRFFYADFADEKTAVSVKDKLAGKVIDGHQLQAEISNPSLRRPRDMDPASHQIHLHNLNFKQTTEETLRKFFLSWGIVTNVYLPLSEANKSKGFLNNGFAFITFSSQESASEALAKGKAKIDDRDIDISPVKPKKASAKTYEGFEENKTVTLKNIDETVTEAQVRIFLEEKIGHANRVSLKPSKQMALVEFQSVADAGKAGVALDGVEFMDRILQVGQKKEFFQESHTSKVPNMIPPMLFRRRKR